MNAPTARYPFIDTDPSTGGASLMPFLPLTLKFQQHDVSVRGLLDTGAAINVLPYTVGVKLGAVWEQQATPVRLTGNLAALEARVLLVAAQVGAFNPVRLAFAWTQADNVPLILGQINFFLEFNVCFFRTQSEFEVQPK